MSDGFDVAVSLSVANDICADVGMYARRALPAVHRIIHLTLPTGVGNQAVLDGSHAHGLANGLASIAKTHRTAQERLACLHLFVAAPNALVFFVGQLARSFGACVLYEYDLESNRPGAYEPTLIFPVT